MQPNATDLKVSPRLATPDEANQGRNQSQLAQCLRVSGGPNEATVAPFPASTVGVNEAKQGQMGPGINPHPSLPCERLRRSLRRRGTSHPCPLPVIPAKAGIQALTRVEPQRNYDRNERK